MSSGDTASADALLEWRQYPPFDQITIEALEAAVRTALLAADTGLAELERTVEPTWEGLAVPLERLADPLRRVWGLVGHLMGVRNSPELRTVHERLQPEVVRASSRLRQSRPLFEAWCALRDSAAFAELDHAQQRIVTSSIRDAEHAGVGLDGTQRQRFNAIQEQLAESSTRFGNHVLDATKAWGELLTEAEQVAGLPPAAKAVLAANARAEGHEAATADEGPWRVTLDQPSLLPVLQHARDRALRERVYRAFLTRASSGDLDNTPLIGRILALRREQSGLLGFDTYAERSLDRKMAGSVSRVHELLERLRVAARPAAEADLAEVLELARAEGAPEADDYRPWDQAFWAERLRERRFDLRDEDLRPYFALPRVLEALFGLVERVFGARIEPADGEVPVWHPDVHFFQVRDVASGAVIAACYLDAYARPGEKRGGAWMDMAIGRSAACAPDGAEVRLPVAYIVCNQAAPVDGRPSLMSFREVETLFHEFGHGLQHMLTTVDHGFAAGIENIEWDAVELPSQFMENWCYHRPVLGAMARHHESGEPLPTETVDRLIGARTFRAGSETLRQLQFGFVDLALHHDYDPTGDEDLFAFERRVAEPCTVVPRLPEDRFLCAFGHIFAGGYAAGYYSYKWAEVLAADAWAAFEEAGLDDERAISRLGHRFRDTVLALGGGTHPMAVYRAFRGREPTPDALLRQLGLG